MPPASTSMTPAAEEIGAKEDYALYIVRCEGLPRIATWRKTVRPVYAKFKVRGENSQKRFLDSASAIGAPVTLPAKADLVLDIQLYVQRFLSDRCLATTEVSIDALLSDEFYTVILSPEHPQIRGMENTLITLNVASGRLDSDELERLAEAFAVHKKWSRMVSCVKPLVEIGGAVAEVNPLAKMVLSVLEMGINQLDERLKRLDAIHDLLDAIADAGRRVYAQDEPHYRSKRQVQLKTRDILLGEIHDALVYLRPLSAASAARRSSSHVESRIHEFKKRISTFMDDFESKGSVDTQVAVFTILEEMRLDKLPYARGVRAEPSKRCLPGTRVELLQKIQDWALSPVANRVFLLQGTAGRGKTAVAHTVALSLQEAGFVAPFFAFNRYDQERAAHQLLPTLARQLAERNKLYSQYLCDQPPSQLESRDPATQVQCLIHGGIMDRTVGAPIVFVIDALDECSDARLQAEDRRNMLQRLHDCLVDSQLPSNVRFFLTYRPDEDILECLAQPSMQATRLSIDKVNDTDCDIRAFVESKLAGTHFSGQVDAVARAAQTLFQSAAVLCLELTKVNSPRTVVFPRELMRRIMENPGQPLYETYRAILEAHFDTTSAAVMSALRQLLGWVFVMHSPQPYAVFRSIAKVHLANVDDLDFVFRGLGSLLTGVTPASADPVQPLHMSFRDFILDDTQSQPFSLGNDLAAAHAEVAYACLRIMNDPIVGVRFNILKLSRSFVLKRHIHDLDQRVSNCIASALRYACEHSYVHLSDGAVPSSGLQFVREFTIFLKRNFLFWLETCSWIGVSFQPTVLLHHIWSAAERYEVADLQDFAVDCIRFEEYFRGAISQSPPQVYVSGLKFAPLSSRVGKLYRARFLVPVDISGHARTLGWPGTKPTVVWEGERARDPALPMPILLCQASCMVFDTPTMPKISPYDAAATLCGLAFAPNGKILASLSRDGTIHIRDKQTCGPQRSELWKSRTTSLRPMVFSPDSRLIAVSNMRTLQLWDVEDRRCIAQLTSLRAFCIAFSPDGKYVAYGAVWQEVWLWHLETRRVARAGSAHERRNGTIVYVKFSPDSKTLLSISRGGLLQLWDLDSQQYLPIPSDLSKIFEVPASHSTPAGRSVKTSESTDQATEGRMRACGVAKGGPVLRMSARIFADTNPGSDDKSDDDESGNDAVHVEDVSFSSDGTRVRTVESSKFTGRKKVERVVDLRPKLEDNPRALDQMTCATLSLDGKLIAAGSSRGTVRIWDAETLTQVGQDMKGRIHPINSVAFSPDRKRVASGSKDGTMRIWDVDTQQRWGNVLRLHSHVITCVVFSSDGRYVVTGSLDRTIRIWDIVEECQLGHHLLLDRCVSCVAISPDGLLIACGCSGDPALRIFSMEWGLQIWGRPVSLDPHDWVRSVVFSSDGARVAYCSGLAVHVLDMETWRELGRYLHSGVCSVAFALDDTHVVFGSPNNCVGVWNTATEGERACTFLHGPTQPVQCVASSRHGTTILSCSNEPFVRLWDLAHLPSPSSDDGVTESGTETATRKLQFHIRESGGWLYYIRLSPSDVPAWHHHESTFDEENSVPFLWIPPRLRRFVPRIYSPAARGVISAYSPFTVSLANEKCIDEWAITYKAPPDYRMEQEDDDDEGEDGINAV